MLEKSLLFLVLVTTLVVQKTKAQDPNFHLYLLFGQSNMEGMGTVEAQDKSTNPRVKVLQDQTCTNLGRTYGTWYTAAPPLNRCWSGLGPGDWFGKTMAAGTPASVTIGLVPVANAGCDIAFFQKGAPLGKAGTKGGGPADIPSQFTGGYAWMLDLAKKAQQSGVIKGILFHQGETNTGDPNWKIQVQQIVSDLKKDLSLGNVPFLAGELLYQQYNSCCSRHNVEVNKLTGLIPNAYVISASGLPGKDVAHFTSASYRELGKRYAQKMLSLEESDCPATSIVPSIQVNGGAWQPLATIQVTAGAKVVLSPQPVSGGKWNWTGCGTTDNQREQSITMASNCTAKATYTNACGAMSSLDFVLSLTTSKSCCGKSTSSGFAYCCTNSDPDGDGWGWENNVSCIVPNSSADSDRCTSMVTALDLLYQEVAFQIYPIPSKEKVTLELNETSLPASVMVLSMDGTVVFSSITCSDTQTILDISSLPTGVYLIKMATATTTIVRKLFKTN